MEKIANRGATQFVFFTKYHGDQIKEDEMVGTCNTHDMWNKYKIIAGKLGNRPCGRRRDTSENTIKMDFKDT
jgi:hypothetical protein